MFIRKALCAAVVFALLAGCSSSDDPTPQSDPIGAGSSGDGAPPFGSGATGSNVPDDDNTGGTTDAGGDTGGADTGTGGTTGAGGDTGGANTGTGGTTGAGGDTGGADTGTGDTTDSGGDTGGAADAGGDTGGADGGAADAGNTTSGTGGGASNGVLNGINYIGVAGYAIRANVRVLTFRTDSPVNFLSRFPPEGNPQDNFTSPDPSSAETELASGDCPAGGSYVTTGDTTGPGSFVKTVYSDCANGVETLKGSAKRIENALSVGDFDLTMSYADSANGPGQTVFKGTLVDGQAGTSFTVQRYSRDTPRAGFIISGLGRHEAGIVNTATRMRFEGEAGPIDMTVSIVNLDQPQGPTGPTTGSVSIVAQDGSRIELTPSDTAGIMNITRISPEGESFTDTAGWSELYENP